MRKILFPVLAALSFAGFSTPASATEVTIRINLNGLDVADPRDSVAILDRIDSAVTNACKRASPIYLYSTNATAECVADGTGKALKELDELRSAEPAGQF